MKENTLSPSGFEHYLLEVELDCPASVMTASPLLAQIEVLVIDHLLPVCAWCQHLRDVQGNWYELALVHLDWSALSVSHTICPTCAAGLEI
jgi:hypothetical protein